MTEPAKKPKWDTKTWIIAVLAIVGITSTYIAAKLSGDKIPPSISGFGCASSHIVFEQKKRCGFLDLEQLISVTGTVLRTATHTDGDQSINITLDKKYEHFLYYGGLKNRDYLHVEFMPCERAYGDVASVLKEIASRFKKGLTTRVSVIGRWAFDGVDHRGEWRDQLSKCLGGRDADPKTGWTEIHPAYQVKILE